MLSYDLSKRGEQPLYAYLYALIRADIEKGVLRGGEKLPAKRAFAKHLGISLITVEGAYNQLLAEGYIYAVERKGTYVNELAALPSASDTVAPGLASLQENTSAVATFSVANNVEEKAASYNNFPLSSWGKTMRAVLYQTPEAKLSAPAPNIGMPELRAAIAKHLWKNRALIVDPNNILIGAGAQVLYGIIAQLLGKDSVYALENPGYPLLTSLYAAQGVPSVHIPLDEQGIDMEKLTQSGAQIAHIMPSHQYPTGLVTSAPRRYELLAWALGREERYLIEDDYDCEYRLAGLPIPPLQSIDTGERVIYTNTFSKTLGQALRIAYAILPAHLMNRFHRELGFYSSTVSTIEQLVLAKYIEDGAYERHLNRSRTTYRHIRDAILNAVTAGDFSDLQIRHADSGLSFLITLPPSIKIAPHVQKKMPSFMRTLDEFSLQPGTGFYPAEPSLVVDYSGICPEATGAAGQEMCLFLAEVFS